MSGIIQHFCRANTRAARSSTTLIGSCPSQDPFGDHVKRIMQLIHDFMQLPQDFSLRTCGTQEYEADVVTLNERGKMKQIGSTFIFTWGVSAACRQFFFSLAICV